MKIALIRKNYTPYGGAENYLNLVSNRLLAQGYKIHIFSANIWQEHISYVHHIKTVKKPSFLSNMLFVLNVQRALKKEYFDCILSFERIPFQDIYPVRKKTLNNFSNAVYRAGDGCHREWLDRRRIIEPFFKKLSFSINPHHRTLLYLEKQCFLNSKKIIANSMMVKNDIIRHHNISGDKIHVIYNGVDLHRFKPVTAEQKNIEKKSLGIKENKAILFVGADFKRKGLDTLLKTVSLLDMDDIRLIVAGKNETPQYLRMMKKLGIDKKVTFRGPEREIERLYGISDVFVLPTLYDPFSNATLEAMASGVPVITTRHNGASELIENGIEGFVVDNPLDAVVFAGKISKALNQSEEMGKNARAKAEGFPIEKAVNEIIKTIT